PLLVNRTAIMVRDNTNAEETAFFERVKESFIKTFVRESRWKLFVSGIGTTLLITVLSILFGTMLGFMTYLVCRGGHKAAILIARFAVWMVQGMPVVVLLMILYYIVFKNADIGRTFVAVTGFTLVFGASVYRLLGIGVGAVDRGQMEGALALGYGRVGAFFRIILPQAIPHVLPAYRAEIVALIKATAIVGYIAVQDLTRMGDIVRSRTYEAFFPLIAVAVIYFILAGILTFTVKKITVVFERGKSTDRGLLKGVRLHD
ncbi:MAG: amino acid ABC transporter permease, partial [Lachnospiraceae bacterium]|nr:amino acid ABC transporter permease [Lachnospiraceae bacterium]